MPKTLLYVGPYDMCCSIDISFSVVSYVSTVFELNIVPSVPSTHFLPLKKVTLSLILHLASISPPPPTHYTINGGFNDTVSESPSGRSGAPAISNPGIRTLLIKASHFLPSRIFTSITIDTMVSVIVSMYASLGFDLLRLYPT